MKYIERSSQLFLARMMLVALTIIERSISISCTQQYHMAWFNTLYNCITSIRLLYLLLESVLLSDIVCRF